MNIKKLIVYGTAHKIKSTKDETFGEGTAYDLSGATRDQGNQKIIDLEKEDPLLEFVLDDGTKWMCDAATLHEIYPELDPALKTHNRDSDSDSDSETFELPNMIDAPATERGIVGKIAVKILRVFGKEVVKSKVEEIAERLENKHLTHGIEDTFWKENEKEDFIGEGAGIFTISRQFKFGVFKDETSKNKPYFLFIHGTNSDTRGAFWDLKASPAWKTLHDHYEENVIAFQHRTLSESPLQNTVKLARMLPSGAELHLLTHSRGGIVGDILNKYAEGGAAFNDQHIDLLEKEGNRKNDITAIRELNTIFRGKNLKITKYLRVACPGAGTKLASKRLDHILNVFFNIFKGSVFVDILKELLAAAVKTKNNPEILPGLEAMNPESPFIKILNDQYDKNTIDGRPLAVISGNGRVNLSGKGLLALLGKLFYWQRNDLVVNTDSMYLGAKRKNEIQYFFDQGIDVNHVKYFENNKTREAINLALKSNWESPIPGFKKVPQSKVPASDRGAIEHGALKPKENIAFGNKPIVVLLPGIMGSNLSMGKKEIWLNYRRILRGQLTNLKYPNVNAIIADSVVKTSYNKLYEWLEGKYDVVVFPFDWRMPLTESAKVFEKKIDELLGHGQPIKIIGHSMGGVLVRDFIIDHPKTWHRLNTSKDFKILFLGSPLSGSHRILTVLFGQDAIIKKLSLLDLMHTKKGLLRTFSKFPGILDLLPIVDPDKDPHNNFADIQVWNTMLKAFDKKDWPLPSQKELARFATYRDKILNSRDDISYDNMVYIAGKDKMTPTGYYADVKEPNELYFLYTSEGDQSVTWELGIPKQMVKKNKVYYTTTSHGALANDPALFSAIEEILSKGDTKLLSTSKPVVRGAEKIFRAEPDIDFDLSEDGLMTTVLGINTEDKAIGSLIPISVTVSLGDLRYSAYPILAGHFMNDGVLHAETAIDRYLNGSLTAKYELGLYPGEIGSNAVFGPTDENDFAGAIIVGMGEPDGLTAYLLAESVEQGVLNYIISTKGKKAPKKGLGISSLVMATGYGGLSIESSMKATIMGVERANQKLKALSELGYGTIQRIEFVERYSNRALNCMYVLKKMAARENSSINIILGSKKMKKLLGIRKRIPLDMSEDWWNRITVRQRKVDPETGELESMVFGASTSDSREEENEIYSSTPLINTFISEISSANNWSPCTAKTLFELLIPNALKEKLRRKGHITWILDTKTASYPWELLQDNTTNAKPLCVNSGMIRQLSTGTYRSNIKRVAQKGALVVADPILEDYIGQLPGAHREGSLVQKQLEMAGYPVEPLIGSTASKIMRKLFCEDYSVIHLAGHGVFKPKAPKESGMVIGKKLFLTVFEIQQMPVVPELVFVNCCHLGYSNDEEEQFFENRYKLAANIGTELIRIGVKAVIAAGWAVNDAAALEFAKVFYKRMLTGSPFGEAVKMARNSVYENYPNTNTWGAYQCYGNPFFKLRNISKGPWSPSYIVAEEAEIHLENLLNNLQMANIERQSALDELKVILDAVNEIEDSPTASIIEREAKIYQELGLYGKAVPKFEELLKLEKANFSFACMETYCNTVIKWCIREVFENEKSHLTQTQAVDKTKKAIRDLEVLIDAGGTAERFNLLGSAHKRLAMLHYRGKKARTSAYSKAFDYYVKAYAHKSNTNTNYSLTNAVELAFLLNSERIPFEGKINREKESFDMQVSNDAKRILNQHRTELCAKISETDMTYWDMVALQNIDMCLLIIANDTSNERKQWDKLIAQFNMLWKKAGSEAKKIAELEHLQFLIHSLNTAAGQKKSFSQIGHTSLKEKLEVYIDELRAALNAIRKMK